MTDAIATAAAAAALEVPGELLEAGAASVERSTGWSTKAQARLIEARPAVHYREHAQHIAHRWAADPDVPGAAVAAALRAAAAAAVAVRSEHDVSLVWTGPSTDALGLRSTRAVLATLVANAIENLILVSYTTFDVDELAASLRIAIDRGVDVSLVLETTKWSAS